MSWRDDLVTAVQSAVQSLALSGLADAAVAEWKGEERAFNDSAVFPAVYVHYAGATFGDDLEQGAATYERIVDLRVYVTDDDLAAARAILEAVEEALSGQELTAAATGTWVDIRAERFLSAVLDRYLYEQTYTVTLLETRDD